jgi:hypothetical protein
MHRAGRYALSMTIPESLLGRIRRPVFAWALTALVSEFIVEWLLGRQSAPFGTARVVLALVPVIPSLLFMLALVRMVQQMDELQRRICLESVFIAFTGSLVLTFILGGLEQAGVYRLRGDAIGTPMMAMWACGYLYSSWKYR